MQLTHFHDGQNGHMKLTGSHNGPNSSNNNNGSQILPMQSHPGNRGGQVDRGVGAGGGQQMMCVHKNRALFNLNGRKQANLFHKFARWLDATPESSSCCLLPLLLPSPLLPPATCYTVDCSAKQLTKTADSGSQEEKEQEQEQPGVAESRLNSNWRCN